MFMAVTDTAAPIEQNSTTPVSAVAASLVIVSSAVKLGEPLSVPLVFHLTYKVSASVPSVATYPTTFAFTPDVPPVNVVPTKFAKVPV